ncbi:MAG: nitroreductase family deazaflavin-dependent oxidoreductase [Chloroflexi bacterium]|nr:nitroreductase family deazaflavin-dependent oxidoreductase [Chloroflexota bacterium]
MRFFRRLIGRNMVRIYSVTRGLMGHRWVGGTVLLLITTGRKSGKRRTIATFYMRDADSIILIASNGGSPTHPSWYLNLKKNPRCLVQVLGQKQEMSAETTADPKERQALWERAVVFYPTYLDYGEEDRASHSTRASHKSLACQSRAIRNWEIIA